ncbi:MAG: ribosomal protein S18-alanine N-acetyltransferase [Pseudomonadota bacterium]
MKDFKVGANETGVHRGDIQVAPVSHMWLGRLVEIDSTWNPKSWSERLFAQELHNTAGRVRGVFIGAKLVGYLIAHVVIDEAHIVSLGVDPDYRRQGLGRILLNDLLRIAKVENVKVITLQVRASNEGAQRLYRGAGFQVAGVRKHYYSDNNEDAITMRCETRRLGDD